MSNSVDLKKLMNFLSDNMNFEPGEFKDNAFEVKVNYKIEFSKMLEFLSTAINGDEIKTSQKKALLDAQEQAIKHAREQRNKKSEIVFRVSGKDLIEVMNRNVGGSDEVIAF